MLKILITPQAYQDLEDIFEYTFISWGIAQAENYQDNIFDAMNLIAKNPRIGFLYEHKKGNYRIVHVGKHLIFYQSNEFECLIIRILHERMNLNQDLSKK